MSEYFEVPIPDRKLPRGTNVIKFGNGDIELVSFNENILASPSTSNRLSFLKQKGVQMQNLEMGVDSDVKISVPTERFLNNRRIPTMVNYAFDEKGNHAKRYQGSGPKDTSEMTPDDFEIAGSVLDGLKHKLLTALGRMPTDSSSNPNSNPPQDQ